MQPVYCSEKCSSWTCEAFGVRYSTGLFWSAQDMNALAAHPLEKRARMIQ